MDPTPPRTPAQDPATPAALAPLGAGQRFLGALVGWGLLWLGSPGVLRTHGSVVLAVVGIALWGLVELRPLEPGRRVRGFLAHALGALPGAAGLMAWIHYVYWPPLLYIGFGMGVYSAAGGALLRRLAGGRVSPWTPLFVGLAWTAQETLRSVVPTPFGLGWMRLGIHAHAHLWLSGSARVWGVGGLTLVLSSLGGILASAWVLGQGALRRPAALASGLAPFALAVVLALVVRPPATVDGPRVLLVQPGFEQSRKQYGDPEQNFLDTCDLTAAALAAERAAGAPEPDLVCWGESMLPVPLFAPGVEDALVGEQATRAGLGPRDVSRGRQQERVWVLAPLFGVGLREGAAGVLPPGTSFVAGAEALVLDGDTPRWRVAAAVYRPGGERAPLASKQHLVPGAETMYGLEEIGAVHDFIEGVSGYVPRFTPGERTEVFDLSSRDGTSTWPFGLTICFDNAHVGPYADPVARRRVDFHLVVSNEAWYRESFEADQMVAFSRIAALASGRSVVRATNSGISLVMGPDGRETARLVAPGGADRMVAGHLGAPVPVPRAPGEPPTPFSRSRRAWLGLWIALPLLLAGVRRGRAGSGADARPAT